MNQFARAGYATKEMGILNRCRLFCQVDAISDVAEGNGIQLSTRFITTHNPRNLAHGIDWPEQGDIPKREWEFWKTALLTALCQPRSLRLNQTLGLWTIPEEDYRAQWDWFLSSEEGLYYRENEVQWIRYPNKIQVRTRKVRYSKLEQEMVTEPPGDIKRTTVQIQNNSIEVFGSRSRQTTRQPVPLKTWMEHLKEYADIEWIGQWIHLPEINRGSGKIIGVSDGSYDPTTDVCSCAWVIRFEDGKEAKGGGVIPGPEGEGSAFRAELGGILSQVAVLQALEKTGYKFQADIIIGCDGESALFKSLLTDREYFSTQHKCFDLISRIIATKESIKATLTPTHVKGHQEDLRNNLTAMEKLNVRMDKLAKEILTKNTEENMEIQDALPVDNRGIIQVDLENVPITSNLSSTLQERIGRNRLLDWWEYKGRIRRHVKPKDIDWVVMRRVRDEQSFRMNRFSTKWVSHHIAVGRMMAFRQARDQNKCPRCGCEHENTLHVLRCPSRESQKKKTARKWSRI